MLDNIDYSKLVEAALFMSSKAVSMEDLSKQIGIGSKTTLENIINKLIEKYKNEDTSLEIIKIGDKYMFSLKEPYASKVSKLAGGPEISKGALRILAYVNKNEGILQSALVKIFGGSTYDHIKELTENDFITAKKFKTSKKITTTEKFKEYFNV
ncbi:MAG: SMC-Scp complex subunit ScpB [Candidatus Micrarchaeia archaeon]